MEENFYEFLSLGLAVVIGITGVLAFIYRRGQAHGIDIACGKRIEKKIDKLDKKIDDTRKDGDVVHNELRTGLQQISKDVSELTGAFKTFQQMANKA